MSKGIKRGEKPSCPPANFLDYSSRGLKMAVEAHWSQQGIRGKEDVSPLLIALDTNKYLSWRYD